MIDSKPKFNAINSVFENSRDQTLKIQLSSLTFLLKVESNLAGRPTVKALGYLIKGLFSMISHPTPVLDNIGVVFDYMNAHLILYLAIYVGI